MRLIATQVYICIELAMNVLISTVIINIISQKCWLCEYYVNTKTVFSFNIQFEYNSPVIATFWSTFYWSNNTVYKFGGELCRNWHIVLQHDMYLPVKERMVLLHVSILMA